VHASPSRTSAMLALALAALLLLGALFADPAGALLLIPAGLFLLALAGRDLVQRPVLSADRAGLTIVTGWRRRSVTWPQVERLRVVTDRRAALLELDLGETVVVLTRRRLGRTPYAVLDELDALRRGPPDAS
jgi:hypothetical protein